MCLRPQPKDYGEIFEAEKAKASKKDVNEPLPDGGRFEPKRHSLCWQTKRVMPAIITCCVGQLNVDCQATQHGKNEVESKHYPNKDYF